MCEHDSTKEWWSILRALLEAHRAARTWYENGEFANQHGRTVFNTKRQHVEHEIKSSGQKLRVTAAIAAAINIATE